MDKETVDCLRKESEEAYKVLVNAREVYKLAENTYQKKNDRYMKADYELALVDGRLKKLPAHIPGMKGAPKPINLTLEQIRGIAKVLGVSIDEEGE
jgi:hypothetical protein